MIAPKYLSLIRGQQSRPTFSSFLPFARGEQIYRQGLSLGLYIVSEIAKAHAGIITVHSSSIETTFTFSMPVNRRDL
jgi:signal transduction histidine kinase